MDPNDDDVVYIELGGISEDETEVNQLDVPQSVFDLSNSINDTSSAAFNCVSIIPSI